MLGLLKVVCLDVPGCFWGTLLWVFKALKKYTYQRGLLKTAAS